MSTTAASPVDQRNRRVATIMVVVAVAMLALGYAAVPLYRLFCQVTGWGGTTQRATPEQVAALKPVAGRTVSVRFDGNVASGLPWDFHPSQVTDTVAIGEREMTYFVARNKSARPITGSATFNVSPAQAGKYFTKIECFCFTEQTLAPGQDVRMPVVYFVDPKILEDPDARGIEQITLSYTFNELRQPPGAAPKALDRIAARR